MRIGLLTNLKTHGIDVLVRHGFGSLELLAWPGDPFDPRAVTDRQIEQLRQQLDEHRLELSAVGYYPNHLDGAQQPAVREHFLGVMTLAQRLGAGVVGTFAGREPEQSIADNIPAFRAYWSEMARRAEDQGLKIAFENCPMFHAHPFRGTNIAFTPRAWELMFDAVPSPALGLEWDPSHLICLLIDPVPTIRRFGARIYHVHAKDAEVCWDVVRAQGILDEHAIRHRMPGLGQVNWREVVSALIEVGYRGNLDIEGLHDPVYGGELEELGLLVGLHELRRYLPATNEPSARGAGARPGRAAREGPR